MEIGKNRAFLNKDFETSTNANIGYLIQVSSWDKKLKKEKLVDFSDITFVISNCDRTMHLHFDIDSEKAMDNSIHKLDTIIDMCRNMKKDLKKARKLIIKGQKRKKEKKN